MSDTNSKNATGTKHVRADALASTSFVLAHRSEPDRWDFDWHRQVLGLEDRIIPPPIPDSREARKFASAARHWADTHTKILQAEPKQAHDYVCEAMTKHVNRTTCAVRIKFAFLENDRFDPGRVLHDALHRAAVVLFRGSAGGWPGEAEAIRSIGQQLIDFQSARDNGNDVRFAPVRTLGNCLLCLGAHLRELA